ncbi:hypothetical protein ACFO0U_14860 [Chromohalobacter sarecensis]|uniref:Uncharacterized protein n=1 Tax=Chromohalobacter sarecensis TaxID=245294 RepID=A0ABV9D4V2_9GAMM|nr:hypothetical protein [Chromohalobacter sarecensis]MCK0714186.1 hypothetical protein [Chromohalobacter sarecensis]
MTYSAYPESSLDIVLPIPFPAFSRDAPERRAQRERKLMTVLGELNGKMSKGTVRLLVPHKNAA